MTQPVSHDDVVRLLGDLNDHAVLEVLETRPTISDLEQVALRLAQEDDVLGEMRFAGSGTPKRQNVFFLVQEKALP